MRNRFNIAMIAAMLTAGTENNFIATREFEPKPIEPLPPKGTRFVIDGVEIYALNERNAWRKYRNMDKTNKV